MELHWYPGHMAKARRQLQQRLQLVDVVLEIVDARIPATGRHPELTVANRPLPRVLLLSRTDLADPAVTRAWVRHFVAENLPTVAADLRRGDWVRRVRQALRAKGVAESAQRRHDVRVLVAGLPNVGKSTAINSLVGRAKATTGGRPGVTRSLQWLRAGRGLQLLDSPGVLWPGTTSGTKALYLAATGCVPDGIFDVRVAAAGLLDELVGRFPAAVAARYGDEVVASANETETRPGDEQRTKGEEPVGMPLLAAVARRRGCLIAGGELDLERAAGIVLQDFRTGRLGRLSLERPAAERTENGARAD